MCCQRHVRAGALMSRWMKLREFTNSIREGCGAKREENVENVDQALGFGVAG